MSICCRIDLYSTGRFYSLNLHLYCMFKNFRGGSHSCSVTFTGIAVYQLLLEQPPEDMAVKMNSCLEALTKLRTIMVVVFFFFLHSRTNNRQCLMQTLVITALLSHHKIWALGPNLHHVIWKDNVCRCNLPTWKYCNLNIFVGVGNGHHFFQLLRFKKYLYFVVWPHVHLK